MVRFLSAFAALFCCLSLVVAAPDDTKKSDKKDDKKTEKKADEKELKGTACCAKCELKESGQTKCQTVLLVKEDGKEVKYYFDAASDKKHHSDYCKGKTDITVKAKVTEKDGKKWLEVTKIEKTKKA